jgi:hypothetical protein
MLKSMTKPTAYSVLLSTLVALSSKAFLLAASNHATIWIVPMGLLGSFSGPNAEFVLGRMWERSRESALQFIRLEKTDELQRTASRNEFDRGNCAVIAVPAITK